MTPTDKPPFASLEELDRCVSRRIRGEAVLDDYHRLEATARLAFVRSGEAPRALTEEEVVGMSEERPISPQQAVLADVLHEYLPADIADQILDVFASRLAARAAQRDGGPNG